VQVKVGDANAGRVDGADDVGEIAAAVKPDGDSGGRRLELAEAFQDPFER
jgi:hypothetical protein